MTSMGLALDHFFIMTDPGAPEAELLIELGMTEGSPNTHPGQGTANRRFFFDDAALELLFISNEKEARTGAGSGLRLLDRKERPGASPFGLIVRASNESAAAGFPGWHYYPDYFEGDMHFIVGANSDLLFEPLCVLLPPGMPMAPKQPKSSGPFNEVSEIRISLPAKQVSPTLEMTGAIDRVSLRCGEQHLMEIVFGHEQRREMRDLRPDLPLVFRW